MTREEALPRLRRKEETFFSAAYSALVGDGPASEPRRLCRTSFVIADMARFWFNRGIEELTKANAPKTILGLQD